MPILDLSYTVVVVLDLLSTKQQAGAGVLIYLDGVKHQLAHRANLVLEKPGEGVLPGVGIGIPGQDEVLLCLLQKGYQVGADCAGFLVVTQADHHSGGSDAIIVVIPLNHHTNIGKLSGVVSVNGCLVGIPITIHLQDNKLPYRFSS